ncbi:hypothetical protein H2204_009778 [Knufia peltigerae]|nr:hypothetical protein H2204_009778 [Knufia peltigerae]
MSQLATEFVGKGGERNNWSEPFLASTSWWNNVPVRKILNVWGALEMFRDHIATFGQRLQMAGNSINNVECPMQVHIDCILDAQTGLEPGPMSVKIWEWLLEVL